MAVGTDRAGSHRPDRRRPRGARDRAVPVVGDPVDPGAGGLDHQRLRRAAGRRRAGLRVLPRLGQPQPQDVLHLDRRRARPGRCGRLLLRHPRPAGGRHAARPEHPCVRHQRAPSRRRPGTAPSSRASSTSSRARRCCRPSPTSATCCRCWCCSSHRPDLLPPRRLPPSTSPPDPLFRKALLTMRARTLLLALALATSMTACGDDRRHQRWQQLGRGEGRRHHLRRREDAVHLGRQGHLRRREHRQGRDRGLRLRQGLGRRVRQGRQRGREHRARHQPRLQRHLHGRRVRGRLQAGPEGRRHPHRDRGLRRGRGQARRPTTARSRSWPPITSSRGSRASPPRSARRSSSSWRTRARSHQHEFEVFGPDGKDVGEVGPTDPGKDGEVILELKTAGTYTFLCGIADHAAQGHEGHVFVVS